MFEQLHVVFFVLFFRVCFCCVRSLSQMLSFGTSELVCFFVDCFRNLCRIEEDFGCCDFVQQNVWSQSTCRSRSGILIYDELVGNCKEAGSLRLRRFRRPSYVLHVSEGVRTPPTTLLRTQNHQKLPGNQVVQRSSVNERSRIS